MYVDGRKVSNKSRSFARVAKVRQSNATHQHEICKWICLENGCCDAENTNSKHTNGMKWWSLMERSRYLKLNPCYCLSTTDITDKRKCWLLSGGTFTNVIRILSLCSSWHLLEKSLIPLRDNSKHFYLNLYVKTIGKSRMLCRNQMKTPIEIGRRFFPASNHYFSENECIRLIMSRWSSTFLWATHLLYSWLVKFFFTIHLICSMTPTMLWSKIHWFPIWPFSFALYSGDLAGMLA